MGKTLKLLKSFWRRHRDISKKFWEILEKFRARAEDRSIDSFSKTETALLDRVEERHFCCLGSSLVCPYYKVRAQLWRLKPAVLTCAGDQKKKCESNQAEKIGNLCRWRRIWRIWSQEPSARQEDVSFNSENQKIVSNQNLDRKGRSSRKV